MFTKIKVGQYIYLDNGKVQIREVVTGVKKTQFYARGYRFSKKTGKCIGYLFYALKTKKKSAKKHKAKEPVMYHIVGEVTGIVYMKNASGELYPLKIQKHPGQHFADIHSNDNEKFNLVRC